MLAMRRALLSFLIMFGLSAATDAQQAATATVHFYRYNQMQGAVLRPSIYVDGKKLLRMDNGAFYDVALPAGEHTFHADDKQAGAIVTLEPGKDYYFRTELQVGFLKGHFRLTMVMPEQGKYDVSRLKPLDKESLAPSPKTKD